jgi:hypothetical protein
MLDGRDLAGRALDQRPQVFPREPTDLDTPTPGLRVEVPKQAARRALVDVDPSLDDRHTTLV